MGEQFDKAFSKFKDSVIKSSDEFNSMSLNVNLHDSVENILAIEKNSKVMIKDRYSNELSASGTADRVRSFTNYGFTNDTLNWPLWLALYNDSWVFRRAIDKPSQDIINCGFSLNGDEDYTKIYRAYERYKSDLTQLLMWGALFGGSIAVMLFDKVSDEEMAKPMKKSQIVGAKMRLYVTDRWYGCSEVNTDTVSNMKDIDFGQPRMYRVTFADGNSLDVHHSYILRYEHRTAPRLVKNGQLQGWGYSEGTHILNELSRDDQLKAAITSLVNKTNIEVIKMKGMRGIFMGADQDNQEQLMKRLEMVNWARTFNSLTFLDKDDDYDMKSFSGMAGLSDLLSVNMKLIGAALEMPGVLFGDLDGGFSADTVAIQRYSIVIKNRADTYFRPVLYKLLKILFIMNEVKGAVSFEFNSLTQIEDNDKIVNAIKNYTNALGDLLSKNLISKYQMALALKDFTQKKVINIQFSKEQLQRMKFEEELDILAIYKKAGKTPPPDDGGMGGLGGNLGGGDLGGGDLGTDLGTDLGGGADLSETGGDLGGSDLSAGETGGSEPEL